MGVTTEPSNRCAALLCLRISIDKTCAVMKMLAVLALAAACAAAPEFGARQGKLKPVHLLSNFEGFVNDFERTDDTYRLEYHVGDSHRFEQRSESGEVTGTYAFVAPDGNEFEFKYDADLDGFRVEGDALPVQPELTDDVKAARDAFFEAYEKQQELTADYEYSEESDESDEDESSEESSEEDSLEGEESSEEESSEEDSEEEEEEEEEPTHRFNISPFGSSSRFSRQVSPASIKPSSAKSSISPNAARPLASTSFFNIPSFYRRS